MSSATLSGTRSDTLPQKAYDVLATLAKGGMGEVLVARERAGDIFDRLVVLKAPLPHLCDEERFISSFLHEARLGASLRHPNIAQIHDVVALDGRPCIVMEFLRGFDLRSVLKRLVETEQQLPLGIAAAVLQGVAAALEHAHGARDAEGKSLGIIHRDISPHNVFITRDGMVKLIDFGIARSKAQLDQTATGVLKGKLAYMAPETLQHERIDPRADLWALGVVAWESLAGRRLFKRPDSESPIGAVLFSDIPDVRDARPELDEGMARLVHALLVRDPDHRTQSAEEVLGQLERWSADHRIDDPRSVKAWLAELFPESEDRDFRKAEKSKTLVVSPEERLEGTETLERDPPATLTVEPPDPTPAPGLGAGGGSGVRTAGARPSNKEPTGPEQAATRILATPNDGDTVVTATAGAAEPEAKRRVGRLVAAGGAGLAVVGAVTAAILVFATMEGDAPAPPAAETPAEPAAASTVELRVEGVPEGAEVFIDGDRRPGHAATIPRSAARHLVEIKSADGEVLLRREVTGEDDATIHFVALPSPAADEDSAEETSGVIAERPRTRRRSTPRDVAPAMGSATADEGMQVGDRRDGMRSGASQMGLGLTIDTGYE